MTAIRKVSRQARPAGSFPPPPSSLMLSLVLFTAGKGRSMQNRTDDQRANTGRKTLGWVRKRGVANTAWKHRFFVLDGHILSYYESDLAYVSGENPRGTIVITKPDKHIRNLAELTHSRPENVAAISWEQFYSNSANHDSYGINMTGTNYHELLTHLSHAEHAKDHDRFHRLSQHLRQHPDHPSRHNVVLAPLVQENAAGDQQGVHQDLPSDHGVVLGRGAAQAHQHAQEYGAKGAFPPHCLLP